jgi:hypothetical protein
MYVKAPHYFDAVLAWRLSLDDEERCATRGLRAAGLDERVAEDYAAFLPAVPKYPLQSRQRGGMKKMEVDVAPASTDRFATMRVNARIFLFIAVLIGIWIKRVIALIALLAAAH